MSVRGKRTQFGTKRQVGLSQETESMLLYIHNLTPTEISHLRNAIRTMELIKSGRRDTYVDNLRVSMDPRRNRTARFVLRKLISSVEKNRRKDNPVYSWAYSDVKFTKAQKTHMKNLGLKELDILHLKRALFHYQKGIRAPNSIPILSHEPRKQAALLALFRTFASTSSRKPPRRGYQLTRNTVSIFRDIYYPLLAKAEQQENLRAKRYVTRFKFTTNKGVKFVWEFPKRLSQKTTDNIFQMLSDGKSLDTILIGVVGTQTTKVYRVNKDNKLIPLGDPMATTPKRKRPLADILHIHGINNKVITVWYTKKRTKTPRKIAQK